MKEFEYERKRQAFPNKNNKSGHENMNIQNPGNVTDISHLRLDIIIQMLIHPAIDLVLPDSKLLALQSAAYPRDET